MTRFHIQFITAGECDAKESKRLEVPYNSFLLLYRINSCGCQLLHEAEFGDERIVRWVANRTNLVGVGSYKSLLTSAPSDVWRDEWRKMGGFIGYRKTDMNVHLSAIAVSI